MRILTVQEMRRVEAATDESGHSYDEMMEQAGWGVAEAVMAQREVREQRILVLVGPGNNGGDGLVAARHLADAGAEVSCYLLKARDTDDDNLEAVQERDVYITNVSDDEDWDILRRLVANADVIIDALLGTGVRLPLHGDVAEMLQHVRDVLEARQARQQSGRRLQAPVQVPRPRVAPLVVAVDGPSGLEYDTGELDPQALRSDITVTFAYPKRGHYMFPGAAACGTLVVADIGVDPDLTQELLGAPALQVATAGWVGELLPERPANAHKGTFGRALVVAGSINYTGAAYLAASSASHVGAGLVTLGVPAAIHGALAAQISEATYLILPQAMGVVNSGAVELVLEKMADYEAMLIGPGLTQEKETVEFVHKLFQAQSPSKRPGRLGFQVSATSEENQEERPEFPPLVIDADGLNALAELEDETWWQRIPSPAVLTPHPGEMARLADCEIQEIEADRPGVARQMAEQWGHIVVLKGAHTVIAGPEGRTVLLPFATPAMATAGTGDVLAGAIVGLLAQGLPAFEAALAGAYVHGLAGTWAGEEIGPAGVVASDLLLRLPRALWRLHLA